jgi:antitoxin ParD1/3/4
MATMNISLPDTLKEWVESRIESGKFSTSSDYVRDLIRNDLERAEYIAYIQKAVDDGIASGFSEVNLDTLADNVIASARAKKSADAA